MENKRTSEREWQRQIRGEKAVGGKEVTEKERINEVRRGRVGVED